MSIEKTFVRAMAVGMALALACGCEPEDDESDDGAGAVGAVGNRRSSMTGFDDIVMSNYTDPPLTTVGVVKEHMGRRAMARLIGLVEGVDARVKLELAPVDLIVRGSTARPES
jgi:hypothetical protein